MAWMRKGPLGSCLNMQEPLRGRSFQRKWVMVGGPWGFRVQPYFLFSPHYLLLSLYLSTVVNYVFLEENKPFLPQVPFVGLFDLSHEKIIKAAAVYSHMLHFLSSFPGITHSSLAFSSYQYAKLLIGLPRPYQIFLGTRVIWPFNSDVYTLDPYPCNRLSTWPLEDHIHCLPCQKCPQNILSKCIWHPTPFADPTAILWCQPHLWPYFYNRLLIIPPNSAHGHYVLLSSADLASHFHCGLFFCRPLILLQPCCSLKYFKSISAPGPLHMPFFLCRMLVPKECIWPVLSLAITQMSLLSVSRFSQTSAPNFSPNPCLSNYSFYTFFFFRNTLPAPHTIYLT